MSNMMDVDDDGKKKSSKKGGGRGSQQEKTVKVHPLAIINISDHHTRVITGGSALPPSSPVLGLLFGYQEGLTISIVDADEMECPPSSDERLIKEHRDGVAKKVELHRKVFPMHEVIGWYRVVGKGNADPTEEDLKVNGGLMKEFNESPLFVLMDAGGGEEKKEGEMSGVAVRESSAGEEARERLERDEQLPLSVYETLVTAAGGGAVFVSLEFELETFEPERIAVERVFETKPAVAAAPSAADKKDASTKGKNTASKSALGDRQEEDSSQVAENPLPQSDLELHLQSVQSSIESMDARVAVLLDFLYKTSKGEIPPDYELLRQVDGLVRQLPSVVERMGKIGGDNLAVLSREFDREYDDMSMLSYLAAVAKTAKAVQGYADKCQLVQDSIAKSREMRRFRM